MHGPRCLISEPGRQQANVGTDRSIDRERPSVEIPRRQPLNLPWPDRARQSDRVMGTYPVVLPLLSEPGEQGVPAVANQQPLADLLQAIRVSDPI